jgi:hypothetical protein
LRITWTGRYHIHSYAVHTQIMNIDQVMSGETVANFTSTLSVYFTVVLVLPAAGIATGYELDD